MKSQSSKAVLSWVFLISFNDLSYGDCWRLNSINQLRPINGRLEALLGVVPPVTQEQWHEVFKNTRTFQNIKKLTTV